MNNVLIIENGINPTKGGVERVSFVLFNGLRNVGYNTYIYYRVNDDDCIPVNCKYRQDSQKSISEQIIECVKKWKINYIICQNLHDPIYVHAYWLVKQKTEVSFITVLHCNPDIWVNKNKMGYTTSCVYLKEYLRSLYFKYVSNKFQRRQKEMYELSDKFVLLSKGYINVFKKLNNVSGNKLAYIENPCSFQGENKSFKKKDTILVVARLEEHQKRISEVIKIWKTVYKDFPDWSMQIVGDGPYMNYYQRYIKRKKIDNISLLGHQAHPENYYKEAKIFIITSTWEGYPMTAIEAMYYGCPIVAYNNYAALEDIIKDGITGYLISTNDRQQFVEKLKLLMMNQELLISMSDNARVASLEKNSLEMYLKKWDDLLRKQL